MAARSIWNGTLTFGTIAIPIKLFSATDSKTISFKEVRESDGARISHKRIGAESGDEVEFKELDKAYDTGKGVVVLTKDEIAAADGTRPKLIEIESFVKGEEIDPVFYDKAYHLGANKGGEHGYRVLLEALEKSGRVGIGRFVLRSREQLVALRPIQGALGLQTMRFADELVAPGDLDFPELTKKPGEKEVAMAGKLVEMLAGEWDPAEYEDTYRDAVRELIKAKAAGEEIKPAEEKEATDDNLMAALQASLEAAAETSSKPRKGTSTPKRPPTKKPTGPKKTAAKAKASATTEDED